LREFSSKKNCSASNDIFQDLIDAGRCTDIACSKSDDATISVDLGTPHQTSNVHKDGVLPPEIPLQVVLHWWIEFVIIILFIR